VTASASDSDRMAEKIDAHDGDPWSEQDLKDLHDDVAAGMSIEEVATKLRRSGTVEEVRAKVADLGITYRQDIVSATLHKDILVLTVHYIRDDGYHFIQFVEPRDWPVIRRLEAESKLTYGDDDAREFVDKLRGLGLDR
jgi:hypothetical protein